VIVCEQEREMVRKQKNAGAKHPQACFEHLKARKQIVVNMRRYRESMLDNSE
jgi:hypothetical protein